MSRMFSSSVEVLADTNVWVAYFRGKPAKAQEQPVAEVLDRLIGEDRVVLCGVVEMELCQGLRENERGTLEAHLSALDFFGDGARRFPPCRFRSGRSQAARYHGSLTRRAGSCALFTPRTDATRERSAFRAYRKP